MGKIITAIFGAGVFGSLIAMRNFIGIALVLSVSTCTFKADIVDYVKQSSKQEHEQRLAQINFETEKLRIEADAKAKQEQEEKQKQEKLEQEQIKREQQRKQAEQQKIEKDNQMRKEVERMNEMKRMAQQKACDEHFAKYKRILACANNPTDSVNCAQGYSTSQWLNGTNTVRQQAYNDSCPVDKPFWRN